MGDRGNNRSKNNLKLKQRNPHGMATCSKSGGKTKSWRGKSDYVRRRQGKRGAGQIVPQKVDGQATNEKDGAKSQHSGLKQKEVCQ